MNALSQLVGFYWVARAGSYAAAARSFPYPITQPAVYKQVRKLEQEIGARLVEPLGREGIRLTPAGERLFAFVEPFLVGLPEVAEALREGDSRGDLRIECSGLVLRSLMPKWLRRVQREYPEIRLHLSEVDVVELRRLRAGDVDLIVEYLPEVPDGLSSRVVANARPFVITPASHPFARQRSLNFHVLEREPLVAYSPQLLHFALQKSGLERAGLPVAPRLTANSVESIMAMVAGGLGFSFIPWLDSKGPRVAGLAARPLPSDDDTFPIRAVWRTASGRRPLIDAALRLAPRAV